MSEELPTGHEFVEANHGLEPAPIAPAPAEPEQYGGGFEELKRAANDHTAERGSSEQEPTERFLEWKSGSKAGQRVDLAKEGFSLTAEAAAKTLSEVHRTEDAMEAHANLSELQREVDLARSQLAGQQPPDGQQQPQAEAPQPQPSDAPQAEASVSEQPSGLSPKLQQALQDPELRAAFEAPYQQAEAARQAYGNAAAEIANVALSSILANFPELQGVSGAQLPTVLAFIQKQDPVKAQAIQNQLQQVNHVYQASQQAQAQQAQIDHQRFQQWSKAQDAALEAKIPEIANDPDMKVSKAALRSLKDVGYSEEELAAAWSGVPFSMRDHRAQLLIWKAAQYDMAKAGIGRPEPKPLPAVQRPGIAPSAGERSSVDLSELRNEFKRASGNEQLRLAAKLQAAQRRARG